MKLKELIDHHRDEFDQAEVPAGLWDSIQPQLKKNKSGNKLPYYGLAAALLAMALFLWWQWPMTSSQEKEPQALPPSFISMENDYKQNLAQIEAHLPLEEYRQQAEYQWIFDELSELEQINAQYRQDISAPVPREELVKVLIDYYEKRLRLLRKLQMEIERNQKLKQNENFNL